MGANSMMTAVKPGQKANSKEWSRPTDFKEQSCQGKKKNWLSQILTMGKTVLRGLDSVERISDRHKNIKPKGGKKDKAITNSRKNKILTKKEKKYLYIRWLVRKQQHTWQRVSSPYSLGSTSVNSTNCRSKIFNRKKRKWKLCLY